MFKIKHLHNIMKLFVGKDIAEVLGYAKPQNAIAIHVDKDDALKQGIIDSLGITEK